jgi:hypothetical protein
VNTNSDSGGRRGVHFDPTINLGHVLSAIAFLASTIAAWMSLNGRVEQQARDIDRIERVGKTEAAKVEATLMMRMNDERARSDQMQLRTSDDIREIKTIVRDGFRELDHKMEKKTDKPLK